MTKKGGLASADIDQDALKGKTPAKPRGYTMAGSQRFEIFAERSKGVIKTGKARRYRWRLIARNGEIVAQSEGYQNKRDCETAVSLLRRWATEGLYEVLYRDAIAPSRSTGRWRNPHEGFIAIEKS